MMMMMMMMVGKIVGKWSKTIAVVPFLLLLVSCFLSSSSTSSFYSLKSIQVEAWKHDDEVHHGQAHAPFSTHHPTTPPNKAGNLIIGANKGIAAFSNPPYIPSACTGNLRVKSVMIAAVRPSLFRKGQACGKVYEVKCTGGVDKSQPSPCNKGCKSVVVTVTDSTSPKHKGPTTPAFVLSKQAFAAIANPDAGLIAIAFKPVCNDKKPFY